MTFKIASGKGISKTAVSTLQLRAHDARCALAEAWQ